MIKLQDFARECGVTDRAIQKHLKTYAEELEGLYQRKGPNGTWLTEEACEFLRGKMKQQPIVVGDAENYRRLDLLEKENAALKDKLIAAMELAQKQQALLDEGKADRLMLQAAEEQNRKAAQDLAEAHQQLGAARQEAQDLRELEQQKAQEAQDAQRRAELAEAELEAYKALPWYRKIFG